MTVLLLRLFFFLQAEDGIRDLVRSRGLGDVYKRQASGSGVRVWDAQTHEEIHTLNREKATSYVTWSPDGKNLASVGGLGVIWNATTGQKVREFETDYAGGPVAWSPIERRIATIYKDQLSTWSWES